MFNFDNVADNFNSHLTGQLSWYPSFMDGMVPEIASYFIRSNSTVYDIGASTGNVQKRINFLLMDRGAKFIPVEKNKSMIDNYWNGLSSTVLHSDINDIEIKPYSFLTSILTLSFIHPFYRKNLINDIKKSCEPGGAVLILEKFQNRAGIVGTLFNRITWSNKLQSKEPIDQIVNKELSLSGAQFPLTDSEIDGFDLIYAYGDFRGYIYINV